MLVISSLLRAISLPPTPAQPQHTHREDEEPKRAKGGDSTPHQLGFGVFVIDSRSSPRLLRATFCLTIDMYSYTTTTYVYVYIPFFFVWAPVRCWLNSSSFFNVIHAFTSGFLVFVVVPPHSSGKHVKRQPNRTRVTVWCCSLQEPQKHLFYFSFLFFFSFKLERREFWEIRQTK
jgi:hypothetical protein